MRSARSDSYYLEAHKSYQLAVAVGGLPHLDTMGHCDICDLDLGVGTRTRKKAKRKIDRYD